MLLGFSYDWCIYFLGGRGDFIIGGGCPEPGRGLSFSSHLILGKSGVGLAPENALLAGFIILQYFYYAMEKEYYHIYLACLILVSIFSLLGCTYVILAYMISKAQANIPQRLILILSIADLVYVLGNLIVTNPDIDVIDRACTASAWLKQFSSQTGFIASFLISLYTYKSITQGARYEDDHRKTVYLICVIPPVITATIPAFGGYSPNLFSCGFDYDGALKAYPIILFYIPFVCLVFSSLSFDWLGYKFLEKIVDETLSQHSTNRKLLKKQRELLLEGKKVLVYLMLYPLVQAMCWSLFFVYGILITFMPEKDFATLAGLRLIASCMQGFFNAIIHYFNQKEEKQQKLNQSKVLTRAQVSMIGDSSEISEDENEIDQDDFYRASRLLVI